jgi:hypothetical protein
VQLAAEHTPVRVRCRDGYEIPNAVIRRMSVAMILVETSEGLEWLGTAAILSIVPRDAARRQPVTS